MRQIMWGRKTLEGKASETKLLCLALTMEEGTRGKKTVFVGGIGDDVDESIIYECFSTFGG